MSISTKKSLSFGLAGSPLRPSNLVSIETTKFNQTFGHSEDRNFVNGMEAASVGKEIDSEQEQTDAET